MPVFPSIHYVLLMMSVAHAPLAVMQVEMHIEEFVDDASQQDKQK
jgi:hypothetical protein